MNDINPYQSPQMLDEMAPAKKSRGSAIKRPFSVWVTLILVILMTALILFGCALGYYRVFSNPGPHLNIPMLALGIVIRLAMIAALFAAIWGIAKRSQIGRWLGLMCLLLIFAAGVFVHLKNPPSADHVTYANDAERAGGTFGEILMAGLLLTLAYRFGFGGKAKAYFSSRPEDEESEANLHW